MSDRLDYKQSEADSATVAQANEARELDLAADKTAISDENKLNIAYIKILKTCPVPLRPDKISKTLPCPKPDETSGVE
jgi:hypothetical protein